MVSPTYHIIAPVLCSGNTFELAERNSMPKCKNVCLSMWKEKGEKERGECKAGQLAGSTGREGEEEEGVEKRKETLAVCICDVTA